MLLYRLCVVSFLLYAVMARRGGSSGGRGSSRSRISVSHKSSSHRSGSSGRSWFFGSGSSRPRSGSSHRSWFSGSGPSHRSSSHHHYHYYHSSPRFRRLFSSTGSAERTALFRGALFGAAAGYLIHQEGKYYINDSDTPIIFDDRPYFWSSELPILTEEFPVLCVNKIDPEDKQFGQIYNENGTRVTEIAYPCAKGESCCGYDCCYERSFWLEFLYEIIYGLLLYLVLFVVLPVVVIAVVFVVKWMYDKCSGVCRRCRRTKLWELVPLRS
ncbi:unnamed protein product [Cylicocyclus nassatus]|uniref:CX domain-containing protein n=1 Tax=Cylicocyclus nassatus TaxID=53992 RepID=A0AA36GV12_CYLNA|nr:unnamed protein product [Cylicocyclus nassatus]